MLKNIFSGQPTKVEFHVTVMSLDSINEGSMVSHLYKKSDDDDDEAVNDADEYDDNYDIVINLIVIEYRYYLTSYMPGKNGDNN